MVELAVLHGIKPVGDLCNNRIPAFRKQFFQIHSADRLIVCNDDTDRILSMRLLLTSKEIQMPYQGFHALARHAADDKDLTRAGCLQILPRI